MKRLASVSSASFLLTAAPVSLVADTVTLPHAFEAGQPASAAEVNANFDAVKTAVDGNAADIAELLERTAALEAELAALREDMASRIGGIGVAVDGTLIGTLMSISPRVGFPSDPNAPDPEASVLYPASISETPALWVLNDRGYAARIAVAPEFGPPLVTPPVQGQLWPGSFVYADPACATEPLVGAVETRERPPAGIGQLVPFPSAWFSSTNAGGVGWVFGAPDPDDPTQTYMVSLSQPTEQVTVLAWKTRSTTNEGADCIVFSTPSTVPVRRVLPNDPEITGVPNDLAGRVTLHTHWVQPK